MITSSFFCDRLTFTLVLLACNFLAVSQNLILNHSNDLPLQSGEIPYWTENSGFDWQQRCESPNAQDGNCYFFAGVSGLAEIMQIIDVSDYSCAIDAGLQSFSFSGYIRSYSQCGSNRDRSRVIIEAINTENTITSLYDSGYQSSISEWMLLSSSFTVPSFTRKIKVRLISQRNCGSNNDGYFDNLMLTPISGNKNIKIDIVHLTNTTCGNNNGTILITSKSSTGQQPLLFSIDGVNFYPENIFTNLHPGSYSVFIMDALGCKVTDSVDIKASDSPPVTTLIQESCMPDDTGKVVNIYKSTFGCDSTVVTITNLISPVLIHRETTTCDPLEVGTKVLNYACDSIVTIVTMLDLSGVPVQTIQLIVCDSSLAETDTLLNNGVNWCSGITIKVSTFQPIKYIEHIRTTCTPTLAGITVDTFGICDSIVVIRTYFDSTLLPVLDLIVEQPHCPGEGGSITPLVVSGGVAPFKFSVSGDGSTNEGDSFNMLNPAIYTIKVEDSSGCYDTFQTEIIRAPEISVFFERDLTIHEGDSVKLQPVIEPSSLLQQFSWKNTMWISCTDCITPYVFPPYSMIYSIQITYNQGCTATAAQKVQVIPHNSFYIPNVIAPNQENNNVLTIFDTGDIELIELIRIYNRWGELVFETRDILPNDLSKGWDGTWKNQFAPSGVYIVNYRMKFRDGSKKTRSSELTLLR